MKKIAFALSVAVLAACVPPPAQRRADAISDVFGGTKVKESAPTRALTLALIPTETTRNTAAHLQAASSMLGGSMIVRDPSSFFKETKAVLDASFAQVVTVANIEEAREKGAHLVGALDLYAKIGNISFQLVIAEITVAFVTPQGEPVATVRGRNTYRMPYPNFGPKWDRTSGGAVTAFEAALSTNTELAAYAAKVTPTIKAAPAATAVAAAPAAPAAPPAKSYRSDADIPGYKLAEDPNKFALVVGVEAYDSLPAADHAARDAKAVKAHLLAAGYPERNVVFMTNAQAGKSAFEKYLEAWLPRNTDEKSTVFFYYSGHGAPDIEKGEAYLMPSDADAKFVETTGYSVKRLYERLNALKAKRVLVAMDACFSGAGGRSVIAKGARPLVGKVDEGRSVAGRVVALTATAADEYTGSDEEAGHGLFTYHLLKSLNAKGGRATLKQLHDDLTPKVRDAARRDNRDQTPQLIGDGGAAL